MSVYRHITHRSSRLKQALATVALLAICATVIPISFSVRTSNGKDQSTPFPCQNRPCGCATAEACWKGCCCFTNEQKLAWARENRVTVPDYVIAAAEKERASQPITVSKRVSKTARHSCCGAGGCEKVSTPKSCCAIDHGPSSTTATDCCDETEKTSVAKRSAESKTIGIVIGALAQQCRGQSVFANSLPWAKLPAWVELNLQHQFSGNVTWTEVQWPSSPAEPPEPPPRLVG